MDYKHLGYFLAVCILVFGSIIAWLIRMVFMERKVIGRLKFLTGISKEDSFNDG